MPIGSYSYSNESDGQRPFEIGEPREAWGFSRGSEGVQAKEPDRQSATRRGGQSSRSRSAMSSAQEEDQPRSQSSSRRGAQARRGSERGQPARRSGAAEPKTSRGKKSRRGFAAMSPEQQREIARKGGLTVSRNRRHMADIGRVGGEHSHGGRRARR